MNLGAKQAPVSLRSTRPRRDLVRVLLATALTFAFASAFELQEKLAALALRFEAWQLDELPSTLTALSLGLAWYAWRRRGETARLLAHNRELAQQMIAVQENERLALARELHDDLAQHCTAIRIEAACIQRAHDRTQITEAAQRVADAAEVLHQTVRRLLRRLRPAELDELGLVAALHALCVDCEQRSGMRCEFVHDVVVQPLGEAIDTAVYRVTQEALSNVMRHARAANACVELRADAKALVLSVQDDGRGFDPASTTHGLGLLGATERAAALGGRLQAGSAPGTGTGARLRMTLPVPMSVPLPMPSSMPSPHGLAA